MTTEATENTESTDIPQQVSETATAFIDRLSTGHEKYAERVEAARARSARVADTVIEAMMAAQRDAIALTKTMAAEPTAYAKNAEAYMDALSTAQERTLDVAKTIYREQADATAEFRSAFEGMFKANEAFTKPFQKMTEMWMPAAK
ncbi:MAG: hypothetical protein ACU85V_17580 [Gammaproteobacteria bacterium]